MLNAVSESVRLSLSNPVLNVKFEQGLVKLRYIEATY